MELRLWMGRTLLVLLMAISGSAVVAYAYLQSPKFGSLPRGERLERVRKSPNFVGGAFRNAIPTPVLTNDSSFLSILFENAFGQKMPRLKPGSPIPAVKTDLHALDRAADVVIWLGHSSYFVQLGGRRILIDPVFSRNAAPVPYANTAFPGTDLYTAEDMPEVDYLLITHDHWDHLDYPTITALRPKVGKVICGLGVGANFERWGYAKDRILEADWFESLALEDGLQVYVLPARHYSGRLMEKNKTLWVAFALETPEKRIFLSGDSGYGPHFAEIGRKFGGFDLAILDAGQYDKRWAHIHMFPEEAAQAAMDLNAKALLPGHIGKFAIANHAWDEPFARLAVASAGKSYDLQTPEIGEPLTLEGSAPSFRQWWKARK